MTPTIATFADGSTVTVDDSRVLVNGGDDSRAGEVAVVLNRRFAEGAYWSALNHTGGFNPALWRAYLADFAPESIYGPPLPEAWTEDPGDGVIQ